VSDGVRTRDRWSHNPELYQLSYAHHAKKQAPMIACCCVQRHGLMRRSTVNLFSLAMIKSRPRARARHVHDEYVLVLVDVDGILEVSSLIVRNEAELFHGIKVEGMNEFTVAKGRNRKCESIRCTGVLDTRASSPLLEFIHWHQAPEAPREQ
jgi:hypothetical protein